MTVRKKVDNSLQKFIEKGASVKEGKDSDFKNILVRVPFSILMDLDESVRKKPWTTRTQWIIEAIYERLQDEMHFGRIRE
jgi:hypothetical protein